MALVPFGDLWQDCKGALYSNYAVQLNSSYIVKESEFMGHVFADQIQINRGELYKIDIFPVHDQDGNVKFVTSKLVTLSPVRCIAHPRVERTVIQFGIDGILWSPIQTTQGDPLSYYFDDNGKLILEEK